MSVWHGATKENDMEIDAEFEERRELEAGTETRTETVKVTTSGIKIALERELVPGPHVVTVPLGFADGTRYTFKIEGEITVETVRTRPLGPPLRDFGSPFGTPLRGFEGIPYAGPVSGFDPPGPWAPPPETAPPSPSPQATPQPQTSPRE